MNSGCFDSQLIKAEAMRLGFSACGISRAEPVDDTTAQAFRRWIATGGHADMAYMDNYADKRLDPTLLVDGARSVISVALNYYPTRQLPPDEYQLAWYAYGKDYHDVVKAKLRQLEAYLHQLCGDRAIESRIFCDTAPVLERYWAERGGIGWRGKSTQLIIPHAGTCFFLGEVIVSAEASAYDRPMKNRCGTCTRCLDACPTKALKAPFCLNSASCLSYLTIEHRGDIPSAEALKMGNKIYGCDECQRACPWNRFATPCTTAEFQPSEELLQMDREQWHELSEERYRRLFKGSAVKRAKYSGLMRNIRAAMKGKLLTLLTTIACLLITVGAGAQELPTTLTDDIFQDLVVDNYADEETDWSELVERLHEQIHQPVNLNTATRQELEQFSFLTPQQVENILAYIYEHGEMKSLSELMLVSNLGVRCIKLLTPFVCAQPVENSSRLKAADVLRGGRHEVVARLDIPFYRRAGYTDTYLGPALYQSVKYKFTYRKRISFGLNAEKDAGEPFGALCNKKGYDYYSAHLLITDVGLFKTLLIGDYGLNFGQGLVMNTDFCISSSSYSFSSPFATGGIRKHTSMAESNFFRGVATTIRTARELNITPFYSCKAIDGNVDSYGRLTSIVTTGLHRSSSEMEKKHTATLQTAGANAAWLHGPLHLGLTGIYYWLSRDYQPDLSGYRKFNIHGQRFFNASIDYGYHLRRLSLAGEVATGSSGMAVINKLSYNATRDYRFILIHRYYSHNYWAMFASAFSEGGSVSNENGWYAACSMDIASSLTLFASADLFSFPWKKYRISSSSTGAAATVRASCAVSNGATISAEYKLRRRYRDLAGSSGSATYPYMQHRWRLYADYSIASALQLRTTADANIFSYPTQATTKGMQLTQSATFTPARFPLRLKPLFSIFCTDGYDTRVFVPESGLLYSYSTPSFYGRGIHWSLNASYPFGRHLTAMCKAGQTIYFDRNQIGSSHDLINSNRKTDLQLLIQCKF
jgi:epoxyqueuosine reductase